MLNNIFSSIFNNYTIIKNINKFICDMDHILVHHIYSYII
jgi:hypothetical protein